LSNEKAKKLYFKKVKLFLTRVKNFVRFSIFLKFRKIMFAELLFKT
jgi:hypothetical protein